MQNSNVSHIDNYLKYLSFLCLDPTREKWAKHYLASNNGSMLPFTNRVFIPNIINENDITDLKDFFGEIPFTLWVNKTNNLTNETLEKLGLKLQACFPLMEADLNSLPPLLTDSPIKIQLLQSKEDIISIWVPIATQAYPKISISEFQKYILYLLSTPEYKNMRFYLGLHDGKPCATSLLILKKDVAAVHWVGTIPEYRKNGLGYAISCFPLHEVKHQVSKAILYSSQMGKPLYEKIGFRLVAEACVYGSLH